MKNKDQILLEQAYSKVINENEDKLNDRLKKDQYPNKIDPNTLGSEEEEAIEIEYNGDGYWVDLDYNPPKVIVNIGDDPEDHIVEITKENSPEVYGIVVSLAKEKRDEEREEEEMRNPTNPNWDNPFSRDYEG
jgi:hypothetical protein